MVKGKRRKTKLNIHQETFLVSLSIPSTKYPATSYIMLLLNHP